MLRSEDGEGTLSSVALAVALVLSSHAHPGPVPRSPAYAGPVVQTVSWPEALAIASSPAEMGPYSRPSIALETSCCSGEEVAALLAEYDDWSVDEGLAVSWCESRWKADADNGVDVGLFQDDQAHVSDRETLKDPRTNIAVAHSLYLESGGWSGPWPTCGRF